MPRDVKEQLFAWLSATGGGFTILDNGNIIGYKGCREPQWRGDRVVAYSIHSGHGFVNGEEFTDAALPNFPGAVITMPTDEVEHNPSAACSTGLHVGTWDYASDFSHGSLLVVEVDPNDVISVPYDCNGEKLRCTKYKVIALRCKKQLIPEFLRDITTTHEVNEFVTNNDKLQEWIDPILFLDPSRREKTWDAICHDKPIEDLSQDFHGESVDESSNDVDTASESDDTSLEEDNILNLDEWGSDTPTFVSDDDNEDDDDYDDYDDDDDDDNYYVL